MSASQVIAAERGSLNHISHVSGDTRHMVPRFPAPRAGAVEGLTGLGPAR
ncbi:hypothetical protein SUDANB6_02350 [Streptomyces sp. enrichment culture]